MRDGERAACDKKPSELPFAAAAAASAAPSAAAQL